MYFYNNPNFKNINKFINIFKKARETVIVISLFSMTIFTFVSVLFRYLPNLEPIVWSEEAIRYTFVWVVLLSLSINVEKKDLLGVDIVVNRLPLRLKLLIEIFCKILSIIFLFVIFSRGIRMVHINIVQKASTLPINLAIVYLAIPTGMFISILIFFSQLIEDFINLSKKITNNNKR